MRSSERAERVKVPAPFANRVPTGDVRLTTDLLFRRLAHSKRQSYSYFRVRIASTPRAIRDTKPIARATT